MGFDPTAIGTTSTALAIGQMSDLTGSWQNARFRVDGYGNLYASGGTFSGSLNGATGTFSGTLSAVSGSFVNLTATGSLNMSGNKLVLGDEAAYLQFHNSIINVNGTMLINGAVGTLGSVNVGGDFDISDESTLGTNIITELNNYYIKAEKFHTTTKQLYILGKTPEGDINDYWALWVDSYGRVTQLVKVQ